MAKTILGISAFYHDAAAALVRGGEILKEGLEQRRDLRGPGKGIRDVLQDHAGFGGGPEPTEGLERSEREDHLRLVVVVLVVTVRREIGRAHV